MTDTPSLAQISKASHHFRMVEYTASGFELAGQFIPENIAAVHRKLLMDYLSQGVAALGYRLERIEPNLPRIVVNNDEPNTMREA